MNPVTAGSVDVAIVGGGLAGLCSARELARCGIECRVFEAADHVGGRVTTAEVDGFLIDRGFQVLLRAYPEVRRVIDLDALELAPFQPGSSIRAEGRFWTIVDPWRDPWRGLRTLAAPFVTWGDAARLFALRQRALAGRHGRDFGRPAAAWLRELGFSEGMLERFFQPFFRGVTLDPTLSVPAPYVSFLFALFARGDAALPARGMRALPEWIASQLPPGSVELGARVRAVESRSITFESGARLACRAVVVATDGTTAGRLVGGIDEVHWNGTTTLSYAAPRSPVDAPLLVLNGEADGPVDHLCVPSDVQPTYAPDGRALVSVSVVRAHADGDDALDEGAREQLGRWYGPEVREWELLAIDRIPHALPRWLGESTSRRQVDGVHLAGDHVETPSIQGAMISGRRAAESVATALRGRVARR